MHQRRGQSITGYAYFVNLKRGVPSLSVTCSVAAPDGSPLVTNGTAVAVNNSLLPGLYKYTLLGANTGTAGDYCFLFSVAANTGVDQEQIPALWIVGMSWTEAMDVVLSTLQTSVTTAITGVPALVKASLLGLFQALARSSGAPAAAVTDLNADAGEGAGVGTYNPATDSQQAIRDRGDEAWVTGEGLELTQDNLDDIAAAAAAAILETPANKLATDADGRVTPTPELFGDADLDVKYEWLGENLRSTGSTEYVKVRVTVTEAGAPRTASDFGPPQIAFAATRSAERAYQSMEWESPDIARLLIGPETAVELNAGTYHRFLRMVAGDEDEVQELAGVLVLR